MPAYGPLAHMLLMLPMSERSIQLSYGRAEPIDSASAGAATAAAGAKVSIMAARISGVLKARTRNCTRTKHVLGSGSGAVRRPETTGAPFQRRATRVLALAILMMAFRATR
jgi:hypothetical protein